MLGRIAQRLYQATLPTKLNSSSSNAILRVTNPIISSLRPSSPNSLSLRNLSTSSKDSPGRRIIDYFEKYVSTEERCQFLIKELESTLSNEELTEFYKNINLTNPPNKEEHLRLLYTTCARLKYGESIEKWQKHPVPRESIPGLGERYSTASFVEILKYLPNIILDIHGKKPINFIEFGGFAFNDSFLLTRDFEKQGLRTNGFTGVDIHHVGNIAATTFNNKVAKIENYKIINQDIVKYLRNFQSDRNSHENCVVAIRFLAVFPPAFIDLFFEKMGKSLKHGDIFVFNYTLFDQEAQRVGGLKKSGWELKEESGMHMVYKKNDHQQTFLTKDRVTQLLRDNQFQTLHSQQEETLGPKGTDQVRGQIADQYTRITEFVTKYDP